MQDDSLANVDQFFSSLMTDFPTNFVLVRGRMVGWITVFV